MLRTRSAHNPWPAQVLSRASVFHSSSFQSSHSWMPAPFPPPALVPSIRGASMTTRYAEAGTPAADEDEVKLEASMPAVSVCSMTYWDDHSRKYMDLFPLSTPASSSEDEEDSVDGLYCGSYGPHGIELLALRTRTLSSSDLTSHWPWEGCFAVSPSRTTAHTGLPFEVTQEMVDRGEKVLELMKVTGDLHVPRGQVTARAFLAHSIPEPSSSTVGEEEARESSDDNLPWPIPSATRPLGETYVAHGRIANQVSSSSLSVPYDFV